MKLLICESPGKIAKLSSILGNEFKILASVGHCIDLPEKKLGVKIKKAFEPSYEVIPKKREILDNIISWSKKADQIFLCSDPDREGEFISYIISTVLPKDKKISRATFNSITEQAVLAGIANPREINMDLVNAQMSRRILDRLCGFKVSENVQRFIPGARSAGRVQSSVLALLIDRNAEIEAFIPEEYWDIKGLFQAGKDIVEAVCNIPEFGTSKKCVDPKKLPVFRQHCETTDFVVEDVVVGEERNNPLAPFTASSLVQTASSLLGFSAKKTMTVAQILYQNARISYHRTDSVILSAEFMKDVRSFIGDYGPEYLPDSPNVYKSKMASAQEAHEACRVTHLSDQKFTTDDEGKLYELIWRRSVACQMTPGVFTKTKVVIRDTPRQVATFVCNSKVLKFDGHLMVWRYSQPAVAQPPKIKKGQKLALKELVTEQKFTSPPAKYNDGSIVKKLEELGIGRPATLANMTSTLEDRQYILKEGHALTPTPLGIKLIEHLRSNKFSFLDYQFTSNLEQELDDIANGVKTRTKVLSDFWSVLEKELAVSASAVPTETQYQTPCPTCNGILLAKNGRFGPYVKCSTEGCPYKAALTLEGNIKAKAEVVEHGVCPKCGKKSYLKSGRFGSFVACEDYAPKGKGKCTYTAQVAQDGTIKEKKVAEIVEGIKCPKCSKHIVKRAGRFGDFLSCSGYPKCKTIVNEDGTIKVRTPRGKKGSKKDKK